MKKYILRFIAVALVLVILSCCFVSCGDNPSGTYVSKNTILYTAYKFSSFSDKLVWVLQGDIQLNGTYEIDGDKIYITIADDRQEHTYSKDGDTIYIDGVAYVKE